MHPCRVAGLLQMSIDHIGDQHPVGLHGAHGAKGRIFLGPAALGMRRVIPFEMLGRCAGMRVRVACGDEQVEMRLLLAAIHRRGSWKA